MFQQPCSLTRTLIRTAQCNYLLFLPQAYGREPRRWPLILFLHGAGERGNDLERVRNFGLAGYVQNQPEFPFIVVSPQCPDGQWWTNAVLLALLDEVSERYAVDAGRVYLTGASMGGYGTWNMAAHHPERFAAIAPVCGRGVGMWAWSLGKMPVWIFHGAKDPTVPLDESQRMADALKAQGNRVKFTVYPEAGHDSWTETYRNPELYAWFLKHRR